MEQVVKDLQKKGEGLKRYGSALELNTQQNNHHHTIKFQIPTRFL